MKLDILKTNRFRHNFLIACLFTLLFLVAITITQKKLIKSSIFKLTSFGQTAVNPFTIEKNEGSSNIPSGEKVILPEVSHIAFLKVHKAASTTVQNILYRFGLKRNLSFVLPTRNHILSTEKYRYRPVFPSRSRSGKYDILCNHAVFNQSYFSKVMHPDAVYIAIVREPFSLFVSAAMFYKYMNDGFKYLKKMPGDSFIRDLIVNPEMYEPKPLSKSRTFNFMTRDFGFILNSVEESRQISVKSLDRYLGYLDKVFDLVLVKERFDESLIMLKRKLNWSTKDIIYISKNARTPNLTSPVEFDKELMTKFKELYRFDYRVYNFFSRIFEQKLRGESMLIEEVESFKSVLSQVNHFCTEVQGEGLVVSKSMWNEEFHVTKEDCQLMLLREESFWSKIKTFQKLEQRNIIEGSR